MAERVTLLGQNWAQGSRIWGVNSARVLQLQMALNSVTLADGIRLVLQVSMPGMLQSSEERRVMRRFEMRLPAAVRLVGNPNEFLTETQNVSARGIFFYLDRPLAEGTRIEVTMTLPPHVTLTDALRVRFRAQVVRVESPLPSLRIGVAAAIEEYEYLSSADAPGFAERSGKAGEKLH